MSETLAVLFYLVAQSQRVASINGNQNGESMSVCGVSVAEISQLILNPDARDPGMNWAKYNLHQDLTITCKFLHERDDLKWFWGLRPSTRINTPLAWPYGEHAINREPYKLDRGHIGPGDCLYYVYLSRLLLNVEEEIDGQTISCSLVPSNSSSKEFLSLPERTLNVTLYAKESKCISIPRTSCSIGAIESEDGCTRIWYIIQVASLGTTTAILLGYLLFLLICPYCGDKKTNAHTSGNHEL